MSETIIFIPTYNERENVGNLCTKILALGLNADILFLDDNSPDGTGKILDDLALVHQCVSVIHRTGKLGIGSAHLAGLAWAYDHGYKVLVTMDCDFTHDPKDITRMLAASVNHDVMIGSRHLQSNSLADWNLLRKCLTHIGHFLTRRLLRMPYDATGAFRVYQLSNIPRGIFSLVASTGYAFFFESLFLLDRNRIRIGEIPIVLPARTYGHSKMKFFDAAKGGFHVLTLYAAEHVNPGQFRMASPLSDVRPELVDPQGWDKYWDRKKRASNILYEIIASTYRTLVIRRGLTRVIHRHFPPQSRLLHAGCGSGQVDMLLQVDMKITAVDISVSALKLYRNNNPGAFQTNHASILDLPFDSESVDGVYNLGVMEHFSKEDISKILKEFHRVLVSGGKIILFWPHVRSTSVKVLGFLHWFINNILKKNIILHPPEISLLESKKQATQILLDGGFELIQYSFGPKDGFIQAVVVGRKK